MTPKFAYRALCLLLATFASVHSAAALVGAIDRQNEYPYVVKLSIQYKGGLTASCSGVVHGFILSTAAHCLYNSNGLAVKVTAQYVDTLGVQQTASSRGIYVPQQYIDDDRNYHNSYAGAPHDIGYVVLDKDVVVPGYLHWGIELLRDGSLDTGACDFKIKCPNWWEGDLRNNKIFLGNLRQSLGSDLTKVKVRVVGYGHYRCDDYNQREGNCEADGQRRYTELTLKPDLNNPGAPWLWCTGQNRDGINPIQHGDSGGPVFVQAIDGRWLYVGYTSRGSPSDGCASSMFNDLPLWHRVMTGSYDGWHVRKMQEGQVFNDIHAWDLTVARQLMNEWALIHSAPVDAAIYDQSLLFVSPEGGHTSDDKIAFHRKRVTFPDILAYRRVFLYRWPIRKLTVTDLSTECDTTDQFDECWVRAIVSSRFEGEDGTVADGKFRLSLHAIIPDFSTAALNALTFLPVINDEHCGPVEGIQLPPDLGCQVPSPHWDMGPSTDRFSNVQMVTDGARGPKREFYFRLPSDEQAKLGAKPGALIFSGTRSGNDYSGTAYIFRGKCGPLPYAVSGKVSSGGEWMQMSGLAPVVDEKCHIVSTDREFLEFYYNSDE